MIKARVTPSFKLASQNGKRANVMLKTTRFKDGDDINTASVVSERPPDLSTPIAIGTAQFTHTPNGAPIETPNKVLANRPLNCLLAKSCSKAIMAAAKSIPKNMPCLLV